jgi:hypothetical protein
VQGFFEVRSLGPERPTMRRPVWLGPPEDSLGRVVPLHLELVRTPTLVVAISHAVAYRTGFSFRLVVRRAVEPDDPLEMQRVLAHAARPGTPPAPEVLRVGVRFADGQKATNLDNWWGFLDPQQPERLPPTPVLHAHGGGGGGGRAFDEFFWVWPLPPEGPLAFVVEWPAQQVPLTEIRIEAALLLAAAQQDEPLWPTSPGL